MQILTGVFVSMYYTADTRVAFIRVNYIYRDVIIGWLFRSLHSNGASLFFVCLYIHIARGIYYGSFSLIHVWLVGCLILLLTIGAAFLGYVLP